MPCCLTGTCLLYAARDKAPSTFSLQFGTKFFKHRKNAATLHLTNVFQLLSHVGFYLGHDSLKAGMVAALCVAQGIPEDVLPDFVDTNRSAEGLTGGNPELGEETAETFTAGLVIRPSWEGLAGLQVSIDYYRIEIDDIVAYLGFPLYACFDLTFGFTLDDGVLEGFQFRGGITNLTDTEPVIYPSWVESNTEPSTYDVLGRRYFVRLNYRF